MLIKLINPYFSSLLFHILLLKDLNMPGKRKPRIFWPDYKADHIWEVPKKTFPGVVAHGWVSPEIDEFANELLWILNHRFDKLNDKGNKSSRVQEEIRNWVEELLKKPKPYEFAKKLNENLNDFRLSIQAFPHFVSKTNKSKQITFFQIHYRPVKQRKNIHQFWLFCLLMTLNRFGMEAIGKCQLCHNYFIDIKRRGKKYCSPQCTSLAATRRSILKTSKK